MRLVDEPRGRLLYILEELELTTDGVASKLGTTTVVIEAALDGDVDMLASLPDTLLNTLYEEAIATEHGLAPTTLPIWQRLSSQLRIFTSSFQH